MSFVNACNMGTLINCFPHILGTVTFIGSHLDVVPANPSTWERDPFKLVVEVCF